VALDGARGRFPDEELLVFDAGDLRMVGPVDVERMERNPKIVGGVQAYAAANPERIDPEQLRIGTEHEMEHTADPETARQIALDHLREIPDYYTRLEKLERRYEEGLPPNPGDVVSMPEPPPRVTVGSRSYAMSDVGLLGPTRQSFEGGARVIHGGGNLLRYIWVLEPESGRLEMYRYSDGDWKVLASVGEYPQTVEKLRRSRQLNVVSPEEMEEFEAAMRQRQEETVAALKKSWDENKTDEQRRVDQLVKSYWAEEVQPLVDHYWGSIDMGAYPMGFEYDEDFERRTGKTQQQQAKMYALSLAIKQAGFTDYDSPLESYVTARIGETEDPQAIHWSITEVLDYEYDLAARRAK
jgi:hypothetical protein